MDIKISKEVDVVSREEWGAALPRAAKRLKIPVPNVIFTYCTDTIKRKWPLCKNQEECSSTFQDMQKYYIEEEKIRDIPYNFMVGGDGRVYEGRGWYVKPAKNKRWGCIYGRSIEIAYLGDYHERRPHKKMWRAAWDFLVFGIEQQVVDDDYEFLENYDDKRLEEIQAKKPWYEQWYQHY